MIYQKHHAGTCLNFFTVQCIVVHSPVYIQCMSSVHTVCTIQCTVYSGVQSSTHLGHSWCIAETQLATSGIQPKCTSGTQLDTSGAQFKCTSGVESSVHLVYSPRAHPTVQCTVQCMSSVRPVYTSVCLVYSPVSVSV